MKNLSLPIRFGLVHSAVLIAYFLILALLEKHTNPVYSFVNAIISGLAIYEVIRVAKLQSANGFSYSEGFKAGIITGFIGTIGFTIFFLLYATEIDLDFIPALLETMNGGFNSNVGMVAFVVAIMGFATSVVSALTVMQIFKTTNNVK